MDKAELVPRITIETKYESSQHFAESVPKFLAINWIKQSEF